MLRPLFDALIVGYYEVSDCLPHQNEKELL